jgi:hypothetical protein
MAASEVQMHTLETRNRVSSSLACDNHLMHISPTSRSEAPVELGISICYRRSSMINVAWSFLRYPSVGGKGAV